MLSSALGCKVAEKIISSCASTPSKFCCDWYGTDCALYLLDKVRVNVKFDMVLIGVCLLGGGPHKKL